MIRLTNPTTIASISSSQIGRRRRTTNFSRRTQAITLITRATHAHCSFLHLLIKSSSISHPVLYTVPGCFCAGLPTTLPTRKPTKRPLRPISYRTVNTLTNDFGRDAVDWHLWFSSRTYSSSPLARFASTSMLRYACSLRLVP